MELRLENGIGDKHTTRLTVEANGARNPRLSVDGKNISSKRDRFGNFIFEFQVEQKESLLKVSWS